MKTLPDLLRPGLDIISIGINPSLPSVAQGYYFANPRNRFWPALNASLLIDTQLEPGRKSQIRLLDDFGIGFTDLVKRPSANARDLKTADYRRAAPLLREKLIRHRPLIAWFQGKLAYGHYLRHAEARKEDVAWGRQATTLSGIVCFVTPNPSPANAAYTLDDLTDWLDSLAELRDALNA